MLLNIYANCSNVIPRTEIVVNINDLSGTINIPNTNVPRRLEERKTEALRFEGIEIGGRENQCGTDSKV